MDTMNRLFNAEKYRIEYKNLNGLVTNHITSGAIERTLDTVTVYSFTRRGIRQFRLDGILAVEKSVI